MTQDRTESGKFAPKSDEYRQVRSIRLTDKTWEKMGHAAEAHRITRADLIEQMAENGVFDNSSASINVSKSSAITFDRDQLLAVIEVVVTNPEVTRKGKDKGAVKRGLEALLRHLEVSS